MIFFLFLPFYLVLLFVIFVVTLGAPMPHTLREVLSL